MMNSLLYYVNKKYKKINELKYYFYFIFIIFKIINKS